MSLSKKWLLMALATLALCFCGLIPCMFSAEAEACWHAGFGQCEILPPEGGDQPLYIAGYHSGWEIEGVLDHCQARAVWLDAGGEGVLIIGIDCIALDSGTVGKIRSVLSDIQNCAAIHVYATHTHAGIDTLGLWGPAAVDGKNDAYMQRLIQAAETVGREAAACPQPGKLVYGKVETEGICRDSRFPEVFDPFLYQLRFIPEQGKGLRLYFFGAHAESLRGDNRLLSRDFPGFLCDQVTEATGDAAMFFPGAIGGLIMTREFVGNISARAQDNMRITGEKLAAYALSIEPESERPLDPVLKWSRKSFTVPLDNGAFLLYKMLGILDNRALSGQSATGYVVESEVNILLLEDVAMALIPGEIFPELVLGGAYGEANPEGVNPRPLREMAGEHGIRDLLIVGLANDELGYIVPPSDFLVHENLPYLERVRDGRGEDHYEETNSVGPACAQMVADAFEAALGQSK